MISGFNTDVEHRGQVFHVQTEERGQTHPVVVSLVYCGGEIVGSIEVPCTTAEPAEALDDDAIQKRMREQHQSLIREVRRGKYDPAPLPYGHDLVSDRSLDDLVLDYLGRSVDRIATPDSGIAAVQGAGDALAVGRAVRVARVLGRLERFLDAAQRASAEERPDPAIETPAPAETLAPDEPPALQAETAPSPRATPTPSPRVVARLPARRGSWGRFAVATMLAAVAGIVALVFWGPLPPTTSDGPASPVAREPSHATPAPEAATGTSAIDTHAAPTEPGTPPSAVPATVTRLPDTAAQPSAPLAPPTAEARPTVRAGQLVDLESVDVTPVARRRDLPRYTPSARRTDRQGSVELSLLIDERGQVIDVVVTRDDAGADLTQESVSAVRGWSFSPARKDSQPVRVWQDVAIDFTILPDRSTSVRIRE